MPPPWSFRHWSCLVLPDKAGALGIVASNADADLVPGQHVVEENDAGYTKGCYACRSSKFEEAYAKDGAEIYAKPLDQEFADMLNGQMWDCAICHGDNPENKADAHLSMFTQLSRDSFDDFVPEERACGQCHNTFDHRRFITDQKTMDGYYPYRYGYDVESLWRAAIEDGVRRYRRNPYSI